MSETKSTTGIDQLKRIFVNTSRRLLALLLWLLFLGVVSLRLLHSCQDNTFSASSSLLINEAPVNSVTVEPPNTGIGNSTANITIGSTQASQTTRTEKNQSAYISEADAPERYYGVINREIFTYDSGSGVSDVKGKPTTIALEKQDSERNNELTQVATGYYFGSIRRIDIDELPLPDKLEPSYIDLLIDPDDSPADKSNTEKTQSSSNTLHTVFSGALYRKDEQGETLDSGAEYRSSTQTANAGNIRVSLVALHEDEPFSTGSGSSTSENTQRGLSRASIEQLDLPLTSHLSMDNIIGTHRSSRYRFSGSTRATINQRFSLTNPDILGLTSRLRGENNALAISIGELGNVEGNFLSGFNGLDRSLYRMQFDHASQGLGISSEIWQTDDSDITNENRFGSRVNLAKQLGESNEVQATIASSEDSYSALLDWYISGDSNHEFGAYYFDPEFVWINTTIGNDSLGAFYRLYGRWLGSDISFNTEHRRDGLSGDSSNKNRTHFASLSMNNRLSRRLRLSGYYSFRRNIDGGSNATDTTGNDHTLRSLAVLQHSDDQSSTFGANYRYRQQNQQNSQTHDLQLNYTWRRQFNDNSNFDLGLELGRSSQRSDAQQTSSDDNVSISLVYKTHFRHNATLSAGLNYDWENNDGSSTSSQLGGHINYDWAISPSLSLNAQIDHNLSTIETQSDDISDSLVTATPLDIVEQNTRTTSALLTLRYSVGGNSEPVLIGNGNGTRGAGSLSGRLYIDENNDGSYQENEPGLKGITVYLDSIFATVTNSEGYFQFTRVKTGKHHIYIDESNLPLPWTLRGKEFYETTIDLRQNSKLEIPVSSL